MMSAALDVWRLQLAPPGRLVNSSMYHRGGMFLRKPSYEQRALKLQRELQAELLLSLKQTTD